MLIDLMTLGALAAELDKEKPKWEKDLNDLEKSLGDTDWDKIMRKYDKAAKKDKTGWNEIMDAAEKLKQTSEADLISINISTKDNKLITLTISDSEGGEE